MISKSYNTGVTAVWVEKNYPKSKTFNVKLERNGISELVAVCFNSVYAMDINRYFKERYGIELKQVDHRDIFNEAGELKSTIELNKEIKRIEQKIDYLNSISTRKEVKQLTLIYLDLDSDLKRKCQQLILERNHEK